MGWSKKTRTFISLLGHPLRLARVIGEKILYSRPVQAIRAFYQEKALLLDIVSTDGFYHPLKTRIDTRYFQKFNRNPDLKNPKLYSEKVQWRKLYCPQIKLLAHVTDKAAVYEYVRARIGDEHLVPITWVGDEFTVQTLRDLGDEIVIQPTHRSGQVVFIEQTRYIDYDALEAQLRRMLAWPYSIVGQECWYGHSKPRIIARPLIRNSDGSASLLDCKVHVFRQPDGSSKAIIDIMSRQPRWRASFDDTYRRLDFDWNPMKFPPSTEVPPKPEQFDQMVADALVLGADFDNVRVDFMMGADNYYFTELTFAHNGGRGIIMPREYDEIIGNLWHLDTGNVVKRFFWKARAWLPLWQTEMPMRALRGLYHDKGDWAMPGITKADYDIRYREHQSPLVEADV